MEASRFAAPGQPQEQFWSCSPAATTDAKLREQMLTGVGVADVMSSSPVCG